MTNIRSIDMLSLDDLLEMRGGYVLNFSDRSFAAFFREELNLDIDDPKWADQAHATSRAFSTRSPDA
jgi:hypothetical protein